jgi:hypothetical protein
MSLYDLQQRTEVILKKWVPTLRLTLHACGITCCPRLPREPEA